MTVIFGPSCDDSDALGRLSMLGARLHSDDRHFDMLLTARDLSREYEFAGHARVEDGRLEMAADSFFSSSKPSHFTSRPQTGEPFLS